MYINIENFNNVITALEKTFHKNIFNINEKDENLNSEEIKEYEKCGKDFYECLINEESEDYIFLFGKIC